MPRQAKHLNGETRQTHNPISMGTKLPQNCLECFEENCKLPFSKVLPDRMITDYTYKRHPKCSLKVDSEKNIRSNFNE
jgi:hypothetical protein